MPSSPYFSTPQCASLRGTTNHMRRLGEWGGGTSSFWSRESKSEASDNDAAWRVAVKSRLALVTAFLGTQRLRIVNSLIPRLADEVTRGRSRDEPHVDQRRA